MAKIVINEISQNYAYNTSSSTFATVALPITASWGPAYMDANTLSISEDDMLDRTNWRRFPSSQAGLEEFVATYRGPAANYRLAKDYSYQMAMTLLTAGYDILVCRLCPGTKAQAVFAATESTSLGQSTPPASFRLIVTAKYPGTFGNSLQAIIKQSVDKTYWTLTIYTVNNSNIRTAVESVKFVLDISASTDNLPYVEEVESNFVDFSVDGEFTDKMTLSTNSIRLFNGDDKASDGNRTASDLITQAIELAKARYKYVGSELLSANRYLIALETAKNSSKTSKTAASNIKYNEWLYTSACKVYDLLKDKLAYSPNRIISPGWDDQNISAIDDSNVTLESFVLSALHIKLMDVAYNSRCATALLDIPRSLPRNGVYDETSGTLGYAQQLSRYTPENSDYDVNVALYPTHSALFAPWGQYTYVGMSKMSPASPSFQALLIQRAMLKNQALQYEWALPTNRSHNLKLGKLDYTVPKKLLDQWQSLEGVGVNVITNVPDLGTCLWGNSTLYDVPPATYQALANLSTRYLVNAVENVVYRCGTAITFQYNNNEAYASFYAGVTPILDTMKNVGAIEDYYVKMAADIDGLDQVNCNTVVGKIYLVINGVINDIIVDLIALPPETDLTQFQS